MWQKLYEVVATLVTLAEELRQNREDIKEIRLELRDLTIVVHRLMSDVEHIGARETSEREKLMLQLENALLKFQQDVERRLPPPRE